MQLIDSNAPILAGSWSLSDRRHRWYGSRRRSDSHPEKPAPTHFTRPAPDAPRSNQATPASSPGSLLTKYRLTSPTPLEAVTSAWADCHPNNASLSAPLTLSHDRLSRYTPTSAPSTEATSWLSLTSSAAGRTWSRSRTATRPPAASSTPSGATSRASGHRWSFGATTAATSPQQSFRTVGTFDEDKFTKGLLLFWNAPRSGSASPSQLVFGRPLCDYPLTHRISFAQEWQTPIEELGQRTERVKERRAERYNRSTRTLPPLQVGNSVMVQHPITNRWSTSGKITEVGPNRDYLIKTSAGSVIRRNQRFQRRRILVMPGESGTSLEPLNSQQTSQTLPLPTLSGWSLRPSPIRPRRSQRTPKPVTRFQAGSRK